MPTLAEIAHTSDPQLADQFAEAVCYIIDDQQATGLKQPTMKKATFNEVGPPLLKFVHAALLHTAQPANPPIGSFKYVTRASIAGIIKNATGAKKNQFGRLASDVSRMLQANKLIRRGKGRLIYVAEWHDNLRWFSPDQFDKVLIDWRDEKRIREYEDHPAEVTVVVNLHAVEPPNEYTPENIIRFMKAFVPAALKLQDKYDALLDELAELRRDKEEKQWEEVGEELGKLFE